MTSEKLKSLFTGYRALLNATWTDETQARQLSESLTRLYSSSLAWTTKVAHYKFMCDEAVR